MVSEQPSLPCDSSLFDFAYRGLVLRVGTFMISMTKGSQGCDRIMTVANLANILAFLVCPHSFIVLNCSLSLGAAGCPHLEGRGVHLREYVYCTLSCPPTESINYSYRISVTMMSRLMLNLRDPKMLISTQATTT